MTEEGKIAKRAGYKLPIKVCKSWGGYYIGTNHRGLPISRESVEYYRTEKEAQEALESGKWTQRQNP